MAAEIDPFPPFPGSMFSYGIEVDPGAGGASGSAGPEGAGRGCVVLAEDGELYELQIGLDVDQVESGNPLAMRSRGARQARRPVTGGIRGLRAARRWRRRWSGC